jgi:23S rRNA (guanosine2251-2'-O)-methyltransferase
MHDRIYGVHAVFEALASQRLPIERIHIAREVRSAKLKEILDLAHERGVPVRKEEHSVLDRIAGGAVHQGIVAISAALSYADFEAPFKGDGLPLIVLLDGVEDPHNFGAVIRTAEACGVSGVVVPERHSAPLSATVAKASAGAAAHVPIVRVRNLVNAIDEMKTRGVWIVCVDPLGSRDWTGFD